ncbi:MAG: hypothetical protein HC927_02790 [Deltaproteobacteria bacterium]|nr:hypothetical protein [Deltaproteobacteria bacterium]
MTTTTEDAWDRAKSQFPQGTIIEGYVTKALDTLVCISIPGTEFVGVVVITSLSDKPPPLSSSDFPAVGDSVRAVVIGHRDIGYQIALSLRESDFTRLAGT